MREHQSFLAPVRIASEMKENEGLNGLRRHAVSCNSGHARAGARIAVELFDYPDDS